MNNYLILLNDKFGFMKTSNAVQKKSYQFSLQIIRVCKDLKIRREFELSKQLLKSGTSIGANVEEALGAPSKKDFINKLSIAYKEARETTYWIKLLKSANKIPSSRVMDLLDESQQLERILVSILKTSKLNP
ncbi:MAG: four helix bundle protein [Cyclobacteriaceae bacterium]|nr:MAG: four helix bundle protein [Cyclobacteriaceae bacterium]